MIRPRLPLYPLQPNSHYCAQFRFASTAKSKFPFPNDRHPTPHQIFHLPRGAPPSAIKDRYYELVKEHHPDSPPARNLSPDIAHHRFRAIRTAYDSLQRKSFSPSSSSDSHFAEVLRRSQRQSQTGEQPKWTGKRNEWGGFEYEFSGDSPPPRNTTVGGMFMDNGSFFVALCVFAVGGSLINFYVVSPSQIAARQHAEACQSLEEARQGREEMGRFRRDELRRWADERRRRDTSTVPLDIDDEEKEARARDTWSRVGK